MEGVQDIGSSKDINFAYSEVKDLIDNYAMYGLPLFKATAVKYGWDNPIGDDTGEEDFYNE